ncbi:hypothetical protein BREVUG8_40126 [Brevundimonas sp. G8]|nr:hypothetical protein BREVUG8_40126 [Brevundimonas sp. G8]
MRPCIPFKLGLVRLLKKRRFDPVPAFLVLAMIAVSALLAFMMIKDIWDVTTWL